MDPSLLGSDDSDFVLKEPVEEAHRSDKSATQRAYAHAAGDHDASAHRGPASFSAHLSPLRRHIDGNDDTETTTDIDSDAFADDAQEPNTMGRRGQRASAALPSSYFVSPEDMLERDDADGDDDDGDYFSSHPPQLIPSADGKSSGREELFSDGYFKNSVNSPTAAGTDRLVRGHDDNASTTSEEGSVEVHPSLLRGPLLPASCSSSPSHFAASGQPPTQIKASIPLAPPLPTYLQDRYNYREEEEDIDEWIEFKASSSSEPTPAPRERKGKAVREAVCDHTSTVLLRHNVSSCPVFSVFSNAPSVINAAQREQQYHSPTKSSVTSSWFGRSPDQSAKSPTRSAASFQGPTNAAKPPAGATNNSKGAWVPNFYVDIVFTKRTTIYTTDGPELVDEKTRNIWIVNNGWPGYDYPRCVADGLVFRNRSGWRGLGGPTSAAASDAPNSPVAAAARGSNLPTGSVIATGQDTILPLIGITYLYGADEMLPVHLLTGEKVETAGASGGKAPPTMAASERGRAMFSYIAQGDRKEGSLLPNEIGRNIGLFPNSSPCTPFVHEALSSGLSTTTASDGAQTTAKPHYVALRYLPSLCRSEELLAADTSSLLAAHPLTSPTVTKYSMGPDDADINEDKVFYGQYFRPASAAALKRTLHPMAAKSIGSGNGILPDDPASGTARSLSTAHKVAGHPFYSMRQVLGFDVSPMLAASANLSAPDPVEEEQLLLIKCPSRHAKELLLARIQRALVSFYSAMRRFHSENTIKNPPHSVRRRSSLGASNGADLLTARGQRTKPLGVMGEDICLAACLQRTFHMHFMRRLFFHCANKNKNSFVSAVTKVTKGKGLGVNKVVTGTRQGGGVTTAQRTRSLFEAHTTAEATAAAAIAAHDSTQATKGKKLTAMDTFDAANDDEVVILQRLLKSPPFKDSGVEGFFNYLMLKARTFVSLKKRRFTAESFNLDLAYIRPDIIAMGFPSIGNEALFRNPMQETIRFLETFHNPSGNYPVSLTSLLLALEISHGGCGVPTSCPYNRLLETYPVGPGGSEGFGVMSIGKKEDAQLAGLDAERDTMRSCAMLLPYPSAAQRANMAAKEATKVTPNNQLQSDQRKKVLSTYSAVERFMYHDAAAIARFLCGDQVTNYRIYNLCSERCYPPSRFAGSFERFPSDDHHPSPFNTLLALCVSAGNFLSGGDGSCVPLDTVQDTLPTGMPSTAKPLHHGGGGISDALSAFSSLSSIISGGKHGHLQFMPLNPFQVDSSALQRVVAIHCKAGKGRTGLVCVALMLYLGQFERGYAADASLQARSRLASRKPSHGPAGNHKPQSANSQRSPLLDQRIHPLFRALNWYGITRTHNNKGVSIASQLQFLEYLHWYLESERHRLATLFAGSHHPQDIALVEEHPKLACPVNFPIHFVPHLLRPPPCPTAVLRSISFSPYPCVDLDGKCKPYFIILSRVPGHLHYPSGQREHVSTEADTLQVIYDSRLGSRSQLPSRRVENHLAKSNGSRPAVRVVEKSTISAFHNESAPATPQSNIEDTREAFVLPPGIDPSTIAYFPLRGFEVKGEVRFIFYAEQRSNSLLFGTSNENALGAAEAEAMAAAAADGSTLKLSKKKDHYLFSFWAHTGFLHQQSRSSRICAYTQDGKFSHTSTDSKKSHDNDGDEIGNEGRQSNHHLSRWAHLADSVDCLDLHAMNRPGSGGVIRLRREQLDGASKKNLRLFDSSFTCNLEFTLM